MEDRINKGRKTQKDQGHRMNLQIRAPQVRVIGEDGEMLGVYTVPEAVRLAEEKGLDLIEIAPQASPPTCKIMDYGKWKYENKKKQAEARKNQVVVSVKEVQLRPRTEEHDLETKLKHATRFLLDGDKVKVNLRFSGREMAHQELGFELVNKFTSRLNDISQVEVPPKKEGRQLFAIIAPDATKIKEYKKKKSVAETKPATEDSQTQES